MSNDTTLVSEGGLGTKLHAKWQQWLYGSHQTKQRGASPRRLRLELPTHVRPEIWRNFRNSQLDGDSSPPNGLCLPQPGASLPVELGLTS